MLRVKGGVGGAGALAWGMGCEDSSCRMNSLFVGVHLLSVDARGLALACVCTACGDERGDAHEYPPSYPGRDV